MIKRLGRTLAAVVLLAGLLPAAASAQLGTLLGGQNRYELGQRLRRFELAWQAAGAPARGRSVPAMEAAVNSFFRLQLKQAGRQLDEAYLAVSGGNESPARRWALAQRLQLQPRVADVKDATIKIQLVDFYPAEAPTPDSARVTLRIGRTGEPELAKVAVDLATVREGFDWQVAVLPPGDFELEAQLHHAQASYDVGRALISRVPQWQERLATLATRIEAIGETASPTGLATLRQLLALLEQQRAGRVLETDYPAHELLETCEALCAAGGRSERYFATARAGNYWLTLADGQRELPVRIRVPDRATEPLPVLVAYHGMGGSENMFFETYGAGRLVTLAAERGWLVVAPRQGLFNIAMDCPQLLDVLADHFPIDRRRVFLVGHSMGAAQVVSQVSRHAATVSAAVALGGGRGVRDAAPLKQVPWLVAAGERDFGRRGARALAASLESAGADVRWIEVPQVEHMVIVQAALDDVFSFLDKVQP